MNTQFANVLNGGDGALCELQPAELADVNGGGLIGDVCKAVVASGIALPDVKCCPPDATVVNLQPLVKA
jgi:hypothetical protein